MLFIVSINYLISVLGARGYVRVATALTWIFGCSVLLLNERYNGYRWQHVLGVGGIDGAAWDSSLGVLSVWLDNNRGLFPWHNLFNLVVLRMISFNMDRTWACAGRPITERDGSILTFEKHARKCADCTKITAAENRGEEGACPWWRSNHTRRTHTHIACH